MKWLRCLALIAVAALVSWEYFRVRNQRDEMMALCRRQKDEYSNLARLSKDTMVRNVVLCSRVAHLAEELERRVNGGKKMAEARNAP